MNKVILMGRLTRDPEVRYTPGENSFAIHRLGQEAFESQIGSREQFRKIFGRNWL